MRPTVIAPTLLHTSRVTVLTIPTVLVDVVLTGAASVYEIEANVREATNPIPDDVWAEALDRVAELDDRSSPA